MKILPQVHQLKAVFHVTPEIERSVYYYLLEGSRCYLIDSGVAGCGEQLAGYLQGTGRRMEEVAAIFLTHAHPDHIGGAAEIRQASGCRIYACPEEREWIEDIDKQFAERPIPNFYGLAGASVPVDQTLEEGARWTLEPGITLRVICADGHSAGSKAFLWEEGGVLFTGDAIPLQGDIPIFTSLQQSLATLERLKGIETAEYFCAAWDPYCDRQMALQKIDRARTMLEHMDQTVREILRTGGYQDEDELLQRVFGALHFVGGNPLLRRSVEAAVREARLNGPAGRRQGGKQ